MEQIHLTPKQQEKIINSIERILSRGGSAQVKQRKDDIIVLAERRKIDVSVKK